MTFFASQKVPRCGYNCITSEVLLRELLSSNKVCEVVDETNRTNGFLGGMYVCMCFCRFL
jgi:hypothetical protein